MILRASARPRDKLSAPSTDRRRKTKKTPATVPGSFHCCAIRFFVAPSSRRSAIFSRS